MKKIKFLIPLMGLFMLASCGQEESASGSSVTPDTTSNSGSEVVEPDPYEGKSEAYKSIAKLTSDEKDLLSAKGYVENSMNDYSAYVGTESYKTVSTADEFIDAITKARLDYSYTIDSIDIIGYVVRNNVRKDEATWQNALAKGLYLKDSEGNYNQIPEDTPYSDETYTSALEYYEYSNFSPCTYTQTLNGGGSVKVIEITEDINLGYNLLSDETKENSVVSNFIPESKAATVTMSKMALENGISQIKIENCSNLLIYSKNGAKLTHGGFKVTSCNNITFRNLEMDEMWQWEDSGDKSNTGLGDYDTFGWAYFKISFSDNIWIDHMTFGKSFDGQIDVSNPYYSNCYTAFRAPYGADGSSDVHISWCDFKAGSTDKDGYIYKMLEDAEADYLENYADISGSKYRYYWNLRDTGLILDEIVEAIACPQKKGFLLGDSGDEFYYNYNLNVSFANCRFKNFEDRIPKLRGGNCYMYNCLVDSLEYIELRDYVRSKGATAGGYKLAFTSQGIVCGNGGSVMAENTIFRGIETLIKNNDNKLTNDSGQSGSTYNGGCILTNCTYQRDKDSTVITEQSQMTTTSTGKGTISAENFKWNTEDGEKPFTPTLIALDKTEEVLANSVYGVGTKKLDDMWLLSNYTNIN